MTHKERLLAADMLDMAVNAFSAHTCNDFLFPDEWTLEEKQEFVKSYYEWIGSPEEYDPQHLFLPDYAVMEFLADLLREES